MKTFLFALSLLFAAPALAGDAELRNALAVVAKEIGEFGTVDLPQPGGGTRSVTAEATPPTTWCFWIVIRDRSKDGVATESRERVCP